MEGPVSRDFERWFCFFQTNLENHYAVEFFILALVKKMQGCGSGSVSGSVSGSGLDPDSMPF
jgi:hypothetical protein